jgi:hypothetical protein
VEKTDEELRIEIIKYLQDAYGKSSVQYFPASVIAARIFHRHPELQQQGIRDRLISATYFLYDHGKLKKRTEKGQDLFRLSGSTVNDFSPSQYALKPISSMTINNYGIFVNGANTGNINQNTKEVFETIDKLINVVATAEIENTKKMELVANAETIRAQITSPTPNTDIIKKAWEVVNNATLFGAAAVTVAPLLTQLSSMLGHWIQALP